VCKSEEIEGCSLAATPLCLGFRKRTKFDGLGLFRGYLKAKYEKSCIKRLAEPYCVGFALETYNEVVGVPESYGFDRNSPFETPV